MKKYIILVVCLGIVKICNLSFFTNDLNLCQFMSGFASNLYSYDEGVASSDIDVIDYSFKDNVLYITPTNQEVILPISGIVSEVKSDYIEIQSNNSIYKIYNIKPYYRLYQYYKKGMILGKSEEYRIETMNYQAIVAHLVIRYESI